MSRGIQASISGIEAAKKALKLKGWTQEYLAGASQCSRQTLNRFFKGNAIEKRIFQAICTELELPWIQIAESEPQADQPPSLDELIEMVRVNVYDNIRTKCGSMRVLDMTQPLDLNAIYTAVNILEKITGRRRLEIAELLETCGLENFERFSLSRVQEERVSGLEAVTRHSKLMILGKPGAGKTTFLKHLAIQCSEGVFKKELVPLFITLKDFAEAPQQPNLLGYLTQLFKDYRIASNPKIKTGLEMALMRDDATLVELLLSEGRILVLLDGLDEVREADNSRVLRQIQDFATQFSKNFFVITCRIAAREYTFERFTEVEVADFDKHQIATFTQQWFRAKNDPVKADNFIQKLKEDKGIWELATSPLLLTLLCLVFEESGSFPVNRSELYKEGLDVLLKKWDVKRNIERDQVYKQLSLKRKEDLLSQIALDTFRQGNYFFRQKDLERHITQYIRNLANASQTEVKLEHDSEAVLKSIEAQHGLFVERARGIYSFSHLTFHEYFTARKIVTSSNTDLLLQELVSHVAEKRWREVFLLAAGMLENAESFLQGMKYYIDHMLEQDETLQQFLSWIGQKASYVTSSYNPAAIRAFYFTLARDADLARDLKRYLSSDDQDDKHDPEYKVTARERSLAREHDFRQRVTRNALTRDALNHLYPYHNSLTIRKHIPRRYSDADNVQFLRKIGSLLLMYGISGKKEGEHEIERIRKREIERIRDREIERALSLACALNFDLAQDRDYAHALICVSALERDPALQRKLKILINQLFSKNNWNSSKWWERDGRTWANQFATVIRQYSNTEKTWHFTQAQQELLQQYYDANQLLVACLKSDCYISREIREEIENTLLLPIAPP